MVAKKSISRICSVLFFIIFVLSLTPLQAAHAASVVRYAKPAASGTGDCLSWGNACTLQTGLTGATSGDEIWVEAGTYKPTTDPANRDATFQLKSGVALYGGFIGTEKVRSGRNPATNITILSGDIDNNDSQKPIITDLTTVTGNTTNSYHVVTGADEATLDGFTITAGNANGNDEFSIGSGGGMFNHLSSGASEKVTNVDFSGNSATSNGGGMDNYALSSPTLTNVDFSGNSAAIGGGMYNDSASPILTNVTFSGNTASDGGGMDNDYGGSPTLTKVTFSSNTAGNGGGMYNFFTSPTLTDVTFSGNSTSGGGSGGGMYNFNSSPILTDVTFSVNSAYTGAGMYNDASNPTLTNVTFSVNSAPHGGGMYNDNSSPILTNVTFSGNAAFIGGGMNNNTNSNPQIRNTIFWGNSATAIGFEGTAQIGNNSSTPWVSYSVVQGGCPSGSTCANIIIADPLLGTLGNYGGFTQTIPLLAGSSAIDTGNDAVCPPTDQRGMARPQGAHCDIGAYEYTDTTAPTVNTFTVITLSNSLNIPITAFSATDDMAVTGYLITTSSTPPVTGATGWTSTAPTTYKVLSDGSYTLYPWAKDAAGNVSAVFASPRAVVLDTTAPTVVSSVRADPNPTSATSVHFMVTFSEAVTGVDTADFSLTTTGTLSSASVTGVSGSGTTYTVTVSTGKGCGTLRLDIPVSATITDGVGNTLSGLPYTSGETYTIVCKIFLPLVSRDTP